MQVSSNEFDSDPDDTVDVAPEWMQSDNIELDEFCAKYQELKAQQKMYESLAEELNEPLESLAMMIQGRMGQHKKVRTSAGYTVAWVPYKRKGYSVPATEGERWQLRSPF